MNGDNHPEPDRKDKNEDLGFARVEDGDGLSQVDVPAGFLGPEPTDATLDSDAREVQARGDGFIPADGFPDVGRSEQVGDYKIIRKLGQGGMGVVYEALHLSLNRRVALKLLPGGLASEEHAVERFLREARSAAALHHTNIVPVFDVGCTGELHYYAMQLIEGVPVNEVVRAMREMDSRHEAGEGLAFSHLIQQFTGGALQVDRDSLR